MCGSNWRSRLPSQGISLFYSDFPNLCVSTHFFYKQHTSISIVTLIFGKKIKQIPEPDIASTHQFFKFQFEFRPIFKKVIRIIARLILFLTCEKVPKRMHCDVFLVKSPHFWHFISKRKFKNNSETFLTFFHKSRGWGMSYGILIKKVSSIFPSSIAVLIKIVHEMNWFRDEWKSELSR